MSPEHFFATRRSDGVFTATIKINGITEKFAFTPITAEDMIQQLDDIMEDCCDQSVDKALKDGIMTLFDRYIDEFSQVCPGTYAFRCAIDRHIGVMLTIVDTDHGVREISFEEPTISR